ncbi:MAG: hypothetical protein PHW10_02640 [Candidatus Peribacteraceae bacterium]|nr:hypothetical protein [Candidatus Peribacteraceae bacterium]
MENCSDNSYDATIVRVPEGTKPEEIPRQVQQALDAAKIEGRAYPIDGTPNTFRIETRQQFAAHEVQTALASLAECVQLTPTAQAHTIK